MYEKSDTPADLPEKLISLGIPQALLPEALQWERLYHLVQAIPPNIKPVFNAAWQIHALLAEDYSVFSAEDWAAVDNNGAGLSHYAVWVNNVRALAFIHTHHSVGLTATTNSGTTLAHYAAGFGHIETLTWLHTHYPQLLTALNKYGSTIAHYAATSGHIAVLHWLQAHYPKVLTALNKYGGTIAHYAASSGHIAVLNWLQTDYPKPLTALDKNEATITHYAAAYGQIAALNYGLALSATPHQFTFLSTLTSDQNEKTLASLLQALATNYTLTAVHNWPPEGDAVLKALLDSYLTRNQLIQQAKMRFMVFLQGAYQSPSLVHYLALPELYRLILGFMLPAEVDVARIYNDSEQVVSPAGRYNAALDQAKTVVRQAIDRLTRKPESSLVDILIQEYLYTPATAKIDALNALLTLLNTQPAKKLTQLITAWEHTYSAVITPERNKLYHFFGYASPPTKTVQCVQQVKILLGLGKQELVPQDALSDEELNAQLPSLTR